MSIECTAMRAIRKQTAQLVRLALAAIFLAWPSAASLDPQVSISRYDHEVWQQTPQGISILGVYAVCQTRNGYIWLGTGNGLIRFDGLRFTVFDSGNTPQLKSNQVNTLLEDRQGDLWIGTEGGGLTRLRQGVFFTYTESDGLSSNVIAALSTDQEGNLWIGTDGGGVDRYSQGRFARFTTKDGIAG